MLVNQFYLGMLNINFLSIQHYPINLPGAKNVDLNLKPTGWQTGIVRAINTVVEGITKGHLRSPV